MAKKIKRSDLVQGSLFGKDIDEAKELLMTLEDLIKVYGKAGAAIKKDVLAINEKTTKGQEELNETTKKSVELAEARTDATKKAAEQSKKIIKLEADLLKQKEKGNKALTDEAKLRVKITKARSEEGKNLAKLRAELNKVNKEQRDSAKASLEQNDAYRELVRNTNEAQLNLKRLSAEFGVGSKEAKDAAKQFEKFDNQLREVNDEAKDGRRDVGRYKAEVRELADELKGAANDAGGFGDALDKVTSPVGLVTAAASGLGAAFFATEKGGNKVKDVLSGLQGGFNAVTASVGGFVGSLLDGESISDSYADNIEGVTKRIEEQATANVDATQKARENRIEQRTTSEELARLRGEYELLSQQAGDATTTLEAQQEATVKQAEKAAQITSQELVVLDKQIEAVNLQIEARKGLNNADLLDERQEFVNQQVELEGQLTADLATIGQERNQIEQDQWEQRLDFLFDASDRQKSITEKQLQDDSIATEKRLETFRALSEGIKETYAEIEREFQDASGTQIKIAEFAKLEAIEQAKLIGTLNLSEIERNRLKEAVVEYLQVVQDLEETQADLNDVEEKGLSLQKQIFIQRRRLAGEEINVAEEFTELRKKELEEQIAALDENSIERLEKEKELNSLLLKEQEKAQKEKEKSEKESDQKILDDKEKQKEELLELQKSLISGLRNISDKQTERELERIDAETEAREANIDRLTEGLQNNVKFSDASIAIERKRLQELEAERKKVEEKQARRELFLTGIELLATNEGDLAKTGVQLLGLRELVDSIPTALEGTESTGTISGGGLDGKGGRLWMLHNKEKVFTEEHSSKMGGLANEQVADIVEGHIDGSLYDMQPINGAGNGYDFTRMERKLDELPAKMPQNSLQFNELTRALEERIKVGNKITNNHNKIDGLFS